MCSRDDGAVPSLPHYAAQLGRWTEAVFQPIRAAGDPAQPHSLRQGGKLYDFDLFNLRPGDTMTVSSDQAGDEAPASMTWTVGAVTAGDALRALWG